MAKKKSEKASADRGGRKPAKPAKREQLKTGKTVLWKRVKADAGEEE